MLSAAGAGRGEKDCFETSAEKKKWWCLFYL